jgi:hypothetical protein
MLTTRLTADSTVTNITSLRQAFACGDIANARGEEHDAEKDIDEIEHDAPQNPVAASAKSRTISAASVVPAVRVIFSRLYGCPVKALAERHKEFVRNRFEGVCAR